MNSTHTLVLVLAVASQAMGQALDPQIVWKPLLQLPLTDSAGKTLGGTEIIEIAAHRGKLYAGNSYWGDRVSNTGWVYRGEFHNQQKGEKVDS